MRIISGEFRSRRLLTPKDDAVTRPIPDRVKESLFSLLRGHCEDATVFDGFAGTGAIGLEAVSRGAARCVLIERDRDIAKILEQNVQMLEADDRCEVVIGDALGPGALARAPRPLTLAFLDPPYPLLQEPVGHKRVMAQLANLINLLTDDGFAVLRTPWPLRHREGQLPGEVDPEAEGGFAADVPTRKSRRSKVKADRHQRRRGELDLESPEPVADAEPEDVQDVLEEGTAEPVPPPAPTRWLDVDLTLPNADGPETHAYHTMAIHLYARKRPATA